MNISLTTAGMFDPRVMLAAQQKGSSRLRAATSKAFRESAPAILRDVRNHVGTKLKVRGQKFLRTYKARVFDKKPAQMPAMLVGSTQKIAALHEFGGVVRPRGKLLLVPVGGIRVGAKVFKKRVQQLIASGNAFFKKMPNGNLVLFAENLEQNDGALRAFKRADRAAWGVKSHRRGAEIPIAIGIKEAKLRGRTSVKRVILARLPALSQAIVAAMKAPR